MTNTILYTHVHTYNRTESNFTETFDNKTNVETFEQRLCVPRAASYLNFGENMLQYMNTCFIKASFSIEKKIFATIFYELSTVNHRCLK